MSKFKKWMKSNRLKVSDIKASTCLDEKTITKLRSNKDLDKMKLQTFLKLKDAYPGIHLPSIFPEIKQLCDHQ